MTDYAQHLASSPALTTVQQRRALALVLVHHLYPAATPHLAWQVALWITEGSNL